MELGSRGREKYQYFENTVISLQHGVWQVEEGLRSVSFIFPSRVSSVSALPWETGNLEIALFHFGAACIIKSAKRCEPVQNWHDGVGGAGIQSGSWFIQEQNSRRYYQLHSDVDTLAFTARHAADKRSSDLFISDKYQLSQMDPRDALSRAHCAVDSVINSPSTVASIVNLVRPTTVDHTERPPLSSY